MPALPDVVRISITPQPGPCSFSLPPRSPLFWSMNATPGGSFLALRLLADGRDLKSPKDWVRFAKTSPVLPASAWATCEGAPLVRHRSRG
jgi:hypothetical protein